MDAARIFGWALLTACISFGAGCARKSQETSTRNYHTHVMFNGLPDPLAAGDSVYGESDSRLGGGLLLLKTLRYTASFFSPYDYTDTVVYNAAPAIPGIPTRCAADPGVRSFVIKIPFSIADSIFAHDMPRGSSVLSRLAYRYGIHCDGDLETGEIHIITFVDDGKAPSAY